MCTAVWVAAADVLVHHCRAILPCFSAALQALHLTCRECGEHAHAELHHLLTALQSVSTSLQSCAVIDLTLAYLALHLACRGSL